MHKPASLLAVLALVAGIASPAYADWTSDDEVVELRQSRPTYDGGKTRIGLKSTDCSTGPFYISTDSANKEHQVQMLVAALVSGRKVRLGFTTESDGCSVYSIRAK